jgi:tetratricopeptide (TPR) repeat protein
MTSDPFSFHFPISDFDLSRLPVDPALLRENPSMLVSAIQSFYHQFFLKLGGSANVLVKDGVVAVAWHPTAADPAQQLMAYALKLLKQGDFRGATPLLRAVLVRNPNHKDALYNLGMLLSDQQKMVEAVNLLERFVSLVPESGNGWTALGVAHSRSSNGDRALTSLEKALEVDPQNAYALKNLGALKSKTSPDQGLPFLERAAELLPEDQGAQYGYALCLSQLGRTEEADAILRTVIELNPLSDLAELARKDRSSLANRTMRTAVGGDLRTDVVFYIADALERFEKMGPSKAKTVTFEIAMLGRNGLDINDPAQKYTLRSLGGNFSGLQLTAWMYVGLKMLDPNLDPGIDFSKEHEEAKRFRGLGGGGAS